MFLGIVPLVQRFDEARVRNGKRKRIVGNKIINALISGRPMHRKLYFDTFIDLSEGNVTSVTHTKVFQVFRAVNKEQINTFS